MGVSSRHTVCVPPEPDVTRELVDAYLQAWRRIEAEQQRIASDPLTYRRQNRLREMQQSILRELDDLDEVAADFARRSIPQVYSAGAGRTLAQLGNDPADFTWSGVHRDAMVEVAKDTYDDLLRATDGVRDSTRRLIRAVAREETLQKLAGGKTAVQEGRELATRLIERHGIFAVTYRNGARVGLDAYSAMLARTKTALAYNIGSLNQARKDGVGFVEVFDGAGCGWTSHTDSDIANGTIRPIDMAISQPIAHPNCLRSFGPRPDVNVRNFREQKPFQQVTADQRAREKIAADERDAQARRAANSKRARDRKLAARERKLEQRRQRIESG